MNPARRDDLPPKVLEQLQSDFPGAKIVCIGDVPEDQVPEEVRQYFEEIVNYHEAMLLQGRCIDCGAKMPNFPDEPSQMPEDWTPESGWKIFWQGEGETQKPVAFQCPECDKKDP